MFSKTDFPINCSDLSECVNLPFLKTMTIAELDMAVNELMSYAPSFVKENPIVPFYVLRDRSVLLQLQEFVIDPKRSARYLLKIILIRLNQNFISFFCEHF